MPHPERMRRSARRRSLARFAPTRSRLVPLIVCLGLLFTSGCKILGVLYAKTAPPPIIPAAYKGLTNQSVAIMVWAGEGTMIDFPDVRLDIAGSLQTKLQQAVKTKTKELVGVTFPTSPAAVVRFQQNHPELEAVTPAEVAAKLGARRVIYVELENLQTRSDASVELFRGSASATVKVIEIPEGAAKGTVAYDEGRIAAVFPPHAREEGRPDGNDFTYYRGTVDALTTELAKRFVPHEEEQ
jgi:hypothetical protein